MIYKLLVTFTLFGSIFSTTKNNIEINHNYLDKQIELSVKHFQSEHEDYKKESYFNGIIYYKRPDRRTDVFQFQRRSLSE